MKFLITGATGFVGKHLVKTLRELNHDIVVLSRDGEKAKKALPFHLTAFSWNPIAEPAPAAAFEGVDVVIHLAGEGVAEHRWNAAQKLKIRDSRLYGTQNLVHTINQLKVKPKAFISTSAIGIYGDRSDTVLSESAKVGSGDFLSDVCSLWETEAQKVQGVRLCLVRVGIVLGLEGGALAKMLLPFKLGMGGKLGSGKQWMSWIHVQDLVDLYIHLSLNEAAQGIFNGTAPEPETNLAFTKILGKALGRPTIAPVPAFALKILLGEMSAILLNSQRCRPERALQLGFRFKFVHLAETFADLLKKKDHELIVEQWVPKNLTETFAFFSNARNLEKITPTWLNFTVLNKGDILMEPGALIDYKLRVHGLPVRWRTLIENFTPNKSFVDSQLKGPYKRWHHTHEFMTYKNGTLIRDSIRYRSPLALFSDPLVKRDIADIFAYRKKRIGELFGEG